MSVRARVCVRPSVPVSVPPPRGASFVRPSPGLPRAWFPTEPKRRGGRFLRPQTPTSRREYGPDPRNFPWLTWPRRKTAPTLSLHPEAGRNLLSPPGKSPRELAATFSPGDEGRQTAGPRPQLRGYKQDVSAPGSGRNTGGALPGRGRSAFPSPLAASGPGPAPSPPPARSAPPRRSPGNPPPAHLRQPGPSVRRRARGRHGGLGAHGPTAAAAPPASAGSRASRSVGGGRGRPHLPSATLTTSVCARARGLRVAARLRSAGLRAQRPAPRGPGVRAPGADEGAPRGRPGSGSRPALSAAAGYSAAAAACAGRRDRLPPRPASRLPRLPSRGRPAPS